MRPASTEKARRFGRQAMSSPLQRVLMRKPGASLIAAKADEWHYGPGFDATRAIEQYGVLADLIEDTGAEILWLDNDGDGLADAMFYP